MNMPSDDLDVVDRLLDAARAALPDPAGPVEGFAVFWTLHESCPDCSRCARVASITARATGSGEATDAITRPDGSVEHSAKVRRAA